MLECIISVFIFTINYVTMNNINISKIEVHPSA